MDKDFMPSVWNSSLQAEYSASSSSPSSSLSDRNKVNDKMLSDMKKDKLQKILMEKRQEDYDYLNSTPTIAQHMKQFPRVENEFHQFTSPDTFFKGPECACQDNTSIGSSIGSFSTSVQNDTDEIENFSENFSKNTLINNYENVEDEDDSAITGIQSFKESPHEEIVENVTKTGHEFNYQDASGAVEISNEIEQNSVDNDETKDEDKFEVNENNFFDNLENVVDEFIRREEEINSDEEYTNYNDIKTKITVYENEQQSNSNDLQHEDIEEEKNYRFVEEAYESSKTQKIPSINNKFDMNDRKFLEMATDPKVNSIQEYTNVFYSEVENIPKNEMEELVDNYQSNIENFDWETSLSPLQQTTLSTDYSNDFYKDALKVIRNSKSSFIDDNAFKFDENEMADLNDANELDGDDEALEFATTPRIRSVHDYKNAFYDEIMKINEFEQMDNFRLDYTTDQRPVSRDQMKIFCDQVLELIKEEVKSKNSNDDKSTASIQECKEDDISEFIKNQKIDSIEDDNKNRDCDEFSKFTAERLICSNNGYEIVSNEEILINSELDSSVVGSTKKTKSNSTIKKIDRDINKEDEVKNKNLNRKKNKIQNILNNPDDYLSKVVNDPKIPQKDQIKNVNKIVGNIIEKMEKIVD